MAIPQTIKLIARALDVSANELINAWISEGVDRFMAHHKELKDDDGCPIIDPTSTLSHELEKMNPGWREKGATIITPGPNFPGF